MTAGQKEKIENFAEEFDGIEHLYGDLYRIRRTLIECAEAGLDLDSDELKFGNPRYVKNADGKLIARGLLHDDPDAMDEIRESIRKEGLKDPLQLRPITGEDGETKFQLVDGERRYRGLSKLVSENAECWDAHTRKFVEAKELYDYIDCRIERMDDRTALARSFSGNDRAVGIGEAATAAFVRKLRNCNLSDKEILDITGKGDAWLRETDKLIALDDRTFKALATEQINRRVALKLAGLADDAEREARLDQLLEAAQQRVEKLQKNLENDKQKATEKMELAKAKEVEAKHRGGNVEAAKEEVVKAKQRAKKIDEDKKKLQENGVKATIKDWDEEDVKPLTISKLEKHWCATLEEIIKNEDDDDGNFDLEDARLLKLACDHIKKGEHDVAKVLRLHKGKRKLRDR